MERMAKTSIPSHLPGPQGYYGEEIWGNSWEDSLRLLVFGIMLLGIGVDDMFVIVNTIDQVPDNLKPDTRFI